MVCRLVWGFSCQGAVLQPLRARTRARKGCNTPQAVCVPTSLAQEVGAVLGAQAGEAELREVIGAGGFRNVRRAAETPFNMILEARP
jgi:hypothetical protein